MDCHSYHRLPVLSLCRLCAWALHMKQILIFCYSFYRFGGAFVMQNIHRIDIMWRVKLMASVPGSRFVMKRFWFLWSMNHTQRMRGLSSDNKKSKTTQFFFLLFPHFIFGNTFWRLEASIVNSFNYDWNNLLSFWYFSGNDNKCIEMTTVWQIKAINFLDETHWIFLLKCVFSIYFEQYG